MNKGTCVGCNRIFEYDEKKRKAPKYCHRDCYVNQLRVTSEAKKMNRAIKMFFLLVLVMIVIFIGFFRGKI